MSEFQTIYPTEVMERVSKGEKLNIVDVREHEEVAQGMIPGAKHIPLQELTSRYAEINRGEETIFVCRSGNRSGMACQFLANLGYQSVKNLAGGMNYWQGDVVRK
ncbi:rhodanese-like domain-containing protein [Brevibacillus sp. SYSU BS000544]|uniref:rhodanese-like domain-containing protein n=1 Tax=Brevibacillus sp. SYSU BS000544 TaxID=3416443 RepID=UPI003CE50FB8